MRSPTDCKVALSRGVALHTLDWPGSQPTILLIHPNRTINRVWDHVVAASTLPVLVFGGAEASVLPPAITDRVGTLLPNHQRALLPLADLRLSQDNLKGFAALMDAYIQAFGRHAG